MHQEAVEQECTCQRVKAHRGIREVMQGQVAFQKSVVVGAMKCLYWLCKQEIAHTTNYEALLSLAMSLGCTYLPALNAGRNAHYTSERIIQELVGILAQQVEDSAGSFAPQPLLWPDKYQHFSHKAVSFIWLVCY